MSVTVPFDFTALKIEGDGKFPTLKVPAGKHEVERIPNPAGFPDDWLVLKSDPTVGMSEAGWLQVSGVIEE